MSLTWRLCYADTGERVAPGDRVLDSLGRDWTFACAFKPSINGIEEGEVFVRSTPRKTRGFLTGFFPYLEWRQFTISQASALDAAAKARRTAQ